MKLFIHNQIFGNAGTINISSTGLFHIYNDGDDIKLDGITLDINDGEFRAGDLDSDNEADLLQ